MVFVYGRWTLRLVLAVVKDMWARVARNRAKKFGNLIVHPAYGVSAYDMARLVSNLFPHKG